MNATINTVIDNGYDNLFAGYLKAEAEKAKAEEARKATEKAEAEKVAAKIREPIEALHRGVAAHLEKNYKIEWSKSNHWEYGDVTMIHTVDDVYINLPIEGSRGRYSWRDNGKRTAKLSVNFDHIANYPMKADKTFSVEKIAAKIEEMVKAHKAGEKSKKEKEKNAKTGRDMLWRVANDHGKLRTYDWEHNASWYGKSGTVKLDTNDYGTLTFSVGGINENTAYKLMGYAKTLGLLDTAK